MKDKGKTAKNISVVIGVVLSLLFSTLQLFAIDIGVENHTYGVRFEFNSGTDEDSYIPRLTAEGETAFCLDIEERVSTSGYDKSELTFTIAKKLARIAYFGWYKHRNDSDEELWYAVTQAVIWEEINQGKVTHFYQGEAPFYNNVNQIGVFESRKEDILNQVNGFPILPSWHNSNIVIEPGESQIITDTNNVIADMIIKSNTTGITITRNGNQITLTADENSSNGTILFQKAEDDFVGVPLYYSKAGSQDVGVLRLEDPIQANIKAKVVANGEMEITKINPANTPYTGVEFTLEDSNGITAKFVDNGNGEYTFDDNGIISSLKPNSNGKVLITNLPADNYKLNETGATEGTYTASVEEVEVQVGERTKITVTNKAQTGTLILTKEAEVFSSWQKVNESYDVTTTTVVTKENYPTGKEVKLAKEVLVPTVTTIVSESATETVLEPSEHVSEPDEGNIAETDKEALNEVTEEIEPTTEVKAEEVIENTNFEEWSENSYAIETVATIEVDEQGKVIFNNLEEGKYFLYDWTATEIWQGSVSANGKVEYQFASEKTEEIKEDVSTKTVTVNKPSWDNAGLVNTEFQLFARENIYAPDKKTLIFAKDQFVKAAKTGENGSLTMTDIPLGNYYLQETSVQNGYILDDEKISVSFRPAVPTVKVITKNLGTIENRRIKLSANLKKIMEESIFESNDDAIDDVVFGLFTQERINGLSKNSLVAIAKPNKNGDISVSDILEGKYYIKELATGANYELAVGNYFIDFKRSNETEENQVIETKIVVPNNLIKVKMELVKMDIDTKEFLTGAEFKLEAVKSDGSIIPIPPTNGGGVYVTDKDGKLSFGKLEKGKYRITETKVPKGYLDEKKVIDVIVDETKGQIIRLEFNNKKTQVEVSKYDITTGHLLSGAILELINEEGQVIEQWTSTTKPYIIRGLAVGEKYSVREVKAPNGYATAKSLDFTVENALKGQNIEIANQKTHIEISKNTATTGKELAGAKLQLKDSDSNIVAEWISTTEPYVIYGLSVGHTYTLSEIVAPNGYATASDVTFTISDTDEIQKVKMIDEITKLSILKTDVANGKVLAGAKLQLKDSNNNIVDEWVSTTEAYLIYGLSVGHTYTLREIKAPNGYDLAQDIKFTVLDTNTVQKIIMKDKLIVNDSLPRTGEKNRSYPMLVGVMLLVLLALITKYKLNKKYR